MNHTNGIDSPFAWKRGFWRRLVVGAILAVAFVSTVLAGPPDAANYSEDFSVAERFRRDSAAEAGLKVFPKLGLSSAGPQGGEVTYDLQKLLPGWTKDSIVVLTYQGGGGDVGNQMIGVHCDSGTSADQLAEFSKAAYGKPVVVRGRYLRFRIAWQQTAGELDRQHRFQELTAGGRPLVPTAFQSESGAMGMIADDGSVAVSGKLANDKYVVEMVVPEGVKPRYLRLEASPDEAFVRDMQNPIANLAPSGGIDRQRSRLDALKKLNELHRRDREQNSQLDARISSFELAFQMQRSAPEAFDLSAETQATHQLYGTDKPESELFGRQCLLARRLVERGVRFVQLFDAPSNNVWDHHGGLRENLPKRCHAVDQPITALLTDLKARGLLTDTLVVWGGEFGRTPTAEGNNGREHHPFGFTMWMAGGGVRGGMVHGATDEFGWHSVENKVHVHDLHATILHLTGLDHERLTFRFGGRDYRLTDVHGHVVKEILS